MKNTGTPSKIDKTKFRSLLVDLVVLDNQPFKLVESESLRNLLEYLNPTVRDLHISRDTIRRVIINEFQMKKQKVSFYC